MTDTRDEVRAWLELLGSLSPRRLGLLSEGQAVSADALALASDERKPRLTPAEIDAALAWAQSPHHHLIAWSDARYPALLREIPDPPLCLFVIGDPAHLSRPQIAVVGSRTPTAGGADNAKAFAQALTEAGLVITSGLALGIDACAHRGALAAGSPTVAVAGTGLDRVYPARHRALAHEIAERGVLVSEFMLGTPPRREHFPQRNRVISGLSVGVLVVEAAVHSGSLITARLASEQGREVFAIPGSIHSPLSRGCHALIRQGVKLVESARDVLEELGALASLAGPAHERAPLAPAHPLLTHLGYDPVDVDTLIERSGLTPDAVSSILLELELKGMVTVGPGGKYLRTPS